MVLANKKYVELITGDVYLHKTYNMGMVDKNNCTNFYDGLIRITSPGGKEVAKYDFADYREYIAERVEPWTYLKFPYLKKIGWKGFVDGEESGVYKATPLSRCNVAEGMATPLANAEYKRMYETLGGKPVHHTLATHWARLVELLYAAEHWVELSRDPEITGKEYRTLPTADADRRRGLRRGPAGHAHAPLHHRRARHPHEGEPDRRHDEQQRPDLHVGEEGRPEADPQGRREPGPVEHGRDGLPGLRPVFRLCHAQPARRNAAGSEAAAAGWDGD